MNYHPDDFLALIHEVQEQGGTHTREQCVAPRHKFANQPPDIFHFDEKTPRVTRIVMATGCKHVSKFIVPLLPDEIVARVLPDTVETSTVAIPTGIVGTLARPEVDRRDLDYDDFDFDDDAHPEALSLTGQPLPASVCAVDDAMGLWPRFNAAMHTDESFLAD